MAIAVNDASSDVDLLMERPGGELDKKKRDEYDMAVESWKPRDSDILSWWCQEREETRKEWRNLIRDMNYICCSISAKQTGLRALGTISRHDATIWKSL